VLVIRSMMIRKLLTAAIVLLIAGIAPASPIIGFCTRMPCCNHPFDAQPAFSTETNDCCTTITCYESPSARLTNPTTPDAISAMPAVVPCIVSAPLPQPAARAIVEPSPPMKTRHRLAVLSTLRI